MRTTNVARVVLALALGALVAGSPHAWPHPPAPPAPDAIGRGANMESVDGTVRVVVVNDVVNATTTRLVMVVTANGTVVLLRGGGADAVAAGAGVTVSGRRDGDALFVATVRPRAGASFAAKSAGPESVAEGTLMILHADDLERARSEYLYEVHADDGTVTQIDFGIVPAALQPGMRVRVAGAMRTASPVLEASRVDILAPPPMPKAAKDVSAVTTHPVLVILFKFSNTASDPFPVSTAQQVMISNPASVTNYYAETSYGQHPLNVTVTSSWLQSATLAMPSTCNTADWQAIGNAADSVATAAGYTQAYDFRVYVFPRVTACGWSGLGYIGNPHKAYINGSMSTLVVAHEMGHNFGLLHAASLDCGTAVIGGACTASDYGDPFDVMGNQRAMHFNAAQKSKLGWLPAGAVSTHTQGTSTYTLSPLESGGGTTYAVKIPSLSNRTYWLEYRQPIGMDAALATYPNNGAQIRVASPFETVCSGCNDDTEFLDLTPGTSAFTDGTLVAGTRYRDSQVGLTINVLAASASALTVSVGYTDETPRPDLDASNTTDLIWNNGTSGTTSAWLMNGSAMASGATLLTNLNWNVVATGDFNADGRTDLVWYNAVTGTTSLWLMNGVAMASGSTLLVDPNWRVIRAADFDGDGKSDLLWQNDVTGATAVWLMNGTVFRSGSVILDDPGWRVADVGDFDGDGMSDLLWRNSVTGATAIWLMSAAAYKSGAIVMTDASWRATHVSDFNGDGKSDLIWRNDTTGATAMWLMSGTAFASGAVLLTDVNTRVTHVGDLDNDGKADLLWRNDVSGTTSVSLMNGAAAKSTASLLTDPQMSVTHVGDFDGNGKVDLVWRNSGTGATAIWLMNGTAQAGGGIVMTDPSWHVVNPR